jgi:hypothetical protein
MSFSTQKNVVEVLRDEWRHLTRVNASDRPWQMPVAAALSAGLPIMVGAATDHLGYGLIASLGGMVFLYLPGTPLHHRMVTLRPAPSASSPVTRWASSAISSRWR